MDLDLANLDLHTFLDLLDRHRIWYLMTHVREGHVMIYSASPGYRWEIEFAADGEIVIERFASVDVETDPSSLGSFLSAMMEGSADSDTESERGLP